MRERKNIKIRTDMFEDTKFKLIDRMKEKDLINYVWFRMMTLAGKVNREGDLYLSRSTPYTVETLAIEFNRDESEVRLALCVFMELEMVDIKDNNVITVKNFAKHQGIKVNERKEGSEKKQQELDLIEEDKISNEDITNFMDKIDNKKKSQEFKKQSYNECKADEKDISHNKILTEIKEIEDKDSHNKDRINIMSNNKSSSELQKNTNREIRETLRTVIIDDEYDEVIPLLVDTDVMNDGNKEFIESIGDIEEEEEMCGFIDEEDVKALGEPIRIFTYFDLCNSI